MVPFAVVQIARASAPQKISQGGLIKALRKLPQKVELFYLPHYIFAVEIATPERTVEHVAVDAITGEFSYYVEQPTQDHPDQPSEILPFEISLPVAERHALEGLKRALLQASLKRGRAFEIKRIIARQGLYLPFWVGYDLRKGRVKIAIIDAMEGRPQAGKVKQIILQAISSNQSN